MRNSILSRLVFHSILALLALLVTAGFLLDRYLSEREIGRLEGELARAAGVAAIFLDDGVGALERNLKELSARSGMRYTVIRRDGVVLADSSADPASMDNHADRPEIATALQGRKGSSQRASPTLDLGMLYVAIPTDPVIRVAKPVAEVDVLLQQIRRRIVLACVPAFLLGLALSVGLSLGLKRRIQTMERFAKKLAAGQYEKALAVWGSDELGSLEISLDGLRVELERQINQINADRERLLSLLDGIPDAVLLFDASSRLTAHNRMAERLLELVGKGTAGVYGAEVIRHPGILRRLDAACHGEAIDPAPLGVHWDKGNRELSVTFHAVKTGRGENHILVLLRDMTHEAHLEKVRTDFIANMAHELRTPLTALRGASETLLTTGRDNPALLERFLGTINRHAERLGNILADISQLALTESGAVQAKPTPHDARAVVAEVLALFGDQAERAGVSLLNASPAGAVPLVSDVEVVESILVNLVQNGVRYTPKGGTVTVGVQSLPEGKVEYSVRDTGIGIPPRDLPRVTERFYRVDAGRSRDSGGTGLGLSIVKHLVGLLEGELAIESEYGKGTAVRVTLPSLG
ncbi:MAG: ATP-binding protein [Deferrisomatales bacterium]|nr:ATP-binding protein [Deferrisomatales bacterium]